MQNKPQKSFCQLLGRLKVYVAFSRFKFCKFDGLPRKDLQTRVMATEGKFTPFSNVTSLRAEDWLRSCMFMDLSFFGLNGF